MNKHNKANYDYWKGRAQESQSMVERQNIMIANLIAKQVTQIDRLTNEIQKLRINMNTEFNVGGE